MHSGEALLETTVRFMLFPAAGKSSKRNGILGEEMEKSRVTEDEDDVRRFMTRFERIALFRTADLEANVEYYVRVRALTHPHDAWFFWPWDRGTSSGNANFTFIP